MANNPDSNIATPRDRPLNGKDFERHRGSVHPTAVIGYRPKHPVTISKANDTNSYGRLTDSSSYSEYAWAFLRRNRFYQALIDKTKPAFHLEDWGYRHCKEAEASYGLVKLKPYNEPHDDGTPVQWNAIHAFRKQLYMAYTPVQNRATAHEYPKSQVSIIFDLGPILGPGTPAIELQIALARQKLNEMSEELAKRLEKSEKTPAEVRKNAPTRKTLRAQLRIADLLSAPAVLTPAKEVRPRKTPENPNPQPRNPATAGDRDKVLSLPSTTIGIKEVALFLPEFDLQRKQSQKLTSVQLAARASELAVAAYKSIYEWQCLNWLQFDDWVAHFNALKKKSK